MEIQEQVEQAGASELVVRELRQEEFDFLSQLPPFSELGVGAEGRDSVKVVGAFRGEKLVAYWVLYDAVHVEPLWITPEERGNARLVRSLWTEVLKQLLACGTPLAYALVGDGALAQNGSMAMRLGFRPLAGTAFVLNLEQMLSELPPADTV